MLLYQILAFTIMEKYNKSHTEILNLKHKLQRGMMNLKYLMDHILYQTFKIRIIDEIKTGCNLELLMPETTKLLGSTNSKIIKDINGENVTHLEITEVIVILFLYEYRTYKQIEQKIYNHQLP